jgi:hypothetical protein
MKTKFIFIALLFAFTFLSNLSAQSVRAEKFAQEVSRRLMIGTAPDSGNSPSVYVYNWDFDARLERYTIKLNARWQGSKCFFCTGEVSYEVVGFLEVDRNGCHPVFTIINRNEAAIEACSEENLKKIVEEGAM